MTVVEGDQKGRALHLSLNCSTLSLIRTLYCWGLNKEVLSTIFQVFGMTRPGLEPRSPRPWANTLHTGPTSRWRLECSSMARETCVQSRVESYQRLKKWYLLPPCLTHSNMRYGSRVKWSNRWKGEAPSSTPSKRRPLGPPRLKLPAIYVLIPWFLT